MTRPKLLLADDSVTIRKVIELTFADEGVDVTSVADGDAAMSKFVEIQPDVVLVDAGLPGTSGYQICEMIKGDESTAKIPVLLLVGSFEPFEHDAAEKAGADGFLTKPFHSIRELVNRVQELLGKGTATAESEDISAISVEGEPEDDTHDINDLYERSFAETQPIENYETEPALEDQGTFGDPGMAEAPTTDFSNHSAEEWLDDQMIEAVSTREESPSLDRFIDDEDIVEQKVSPVSEDLGGDADPSELQNTSTLAEDEPAGDASDPQDEAIQAISEYEDAPAAAVDIEPIKEFDWSPAAIITSADESQISAAAGFAPAFLPEDSFIPPSLDTVHRDTEEVHDLDTEEVSESITQTDDSETSVPTDTTALAAEGSVTEPSRELIDLLAKRIVERLSDRVIREVAQEAVPRIAEKLMREALEEEKGRE
ncbi:MAG TPA: response regulator transcription factor [Pyrinomonadaceae bacterium]|nr:response regulator transcription factor [Pyrinomonadaceae bacterium]